MNRSSTRCSPPRTAGRSAAATIPTDELWKIAGLAGMSRPTFDKAIGDTALRDWIIQQQKADTDKWKIDSTPSFVINGQKYAGEMSYDAFRKLIPA